METAPLLMRRLTKCGVYMQWNFILQQRRLKSAGKWMELENIILGEVS
jgi:hypothetical protein